MCLAETAAGCWFSACGRAWLPGCRAGWAGFHRPGVVLSGRRGGSVWSGRGECRQAGERGGELGGPGPGVEHDVLLQRRHPVEPAPDQALIALFRITIVHISSVMAAGSGSSRATSWRSAGPNAGRSPPTGGPAGTGGSCLVASTYTRHPAPLASCAARRPPAPLDQETAWLSLPARARHSGARSRPREWCMGTRGFLLDGGLLGGQFTMRFEDDR
jgi:hypothetical protein